MSVRFLPLTAATTIVSFIGTLVGTLAGTPAAAQPAPPPASDPPPAAPQTAVPPAVPDAPSSAAPSVAPPKQGGLPRGGGLRRKGITWDLTLTGGLRLWDGDEDPSAVWLARARAGALLYREPTFVIAGVTAQAGALDTPAFGFEVEVINLEHGFWGQLGALGDSGGAIASAAGGYTIFGLEYQRRLSGDREGDQALFLMLHVPIGVILVSLQPPPGVVVR